MGRGGSSATSTCANETVPLDDLLVSTAAAVPGVLVSAMAILFGGVTARVDDVTARVGSQETDVLSMDGRLWTVAIGFGKGDQRLQTLERALLPATPPPATRGFSAR